MGNFKKSIVVEIPLSSLYRALTGTRGEGVERTVSRASDEASGLDCELTTNVETSQFKLPVHGSSAQQN